MDSAQKLRGLVGRLTQLKEQYYCGSAEAFGYIKASDRFASMTARLTSAVHNEFNKPFLPTPGVVMELEDCLRSACLEMLLIEWTGGGVETPNPNFDGDELDFEENAAAEATQLWLGDNIERLALAYCTEQSRKARPAKRILKRLLIREFGDLPKSVIDAAGGSLLDDEAFIGSYENRLRGEYFSALQLYRRMVRDGLLYREPHQKLLLERFISCVPDIPVRALNDICSFMRVIDVVASFACDIDDDCIDPIVEPKDANSTGCGDERVEHLKYTAYLKRIAKRNEEYVRELLSSQV